MKLCRLILIMAFEATLLSLHVKPCQAFGFLNVLVQMYMGLIQLFLIDTSACPDSFSAPNEEDMIICTDDWDPVVCDGICMYSNSCHAVSAGFNDNDGPTCWP